jgi:hypothetical protein
MKGLLPAYFCALLLVQGAFRILVRRLVPHIGTRMQYSLDVGTGLKEGHGILRIVGGNDERPAEHSLSDSHGDTRNSPEGILCILISHTIQHAR